MKIFIKEKYKADFTRDVIECILKSMSKHAEYSVCYEEGYGHHLVVEENEKRTYVILSREVADGRNAFLAQYIPTVLYQYIKDKSKKKNICVYLQDVSSKAKTSFNIDTYRSIKTLGLKIANEKELNVGGISPYGSFCEWKNAKMQRQSKNPANQSSYAIDEDDEIVVYGKLFGANGKESVLTACQLSKIAQKEGKSAKYIPVKEHDTTQIGCNDRDLLDYYGVRIDRDYIVVNNQVSITAKSTCRHQDLFRYNLLQKYGYKKCCLCDCDIESNIIASHIHRITDIDNSKLPEEEKRREAVDADNGLWLCANHDKMFEYGIVTLRINGEVVINEVELKDSQIKYVRSITDMSVKKDIISKAFVEYLKIHNRRVRLGND